MAHGILDWEKGSNGMRRVVCECGWRSNFKWKARKNWEDQIESLRQHVRLTFLVD